MRARCGDTLTALEYLERICLQRVLDHLPGARDPMADAWPAHALIELTPPDPDAGLHERLEAALWTLRESMSEMQKPVGASIKHDVAVPVCRVAQFIDDGVAACKAHMPEVRPCPSGHFGDGNIPFNLTRPVAMGASEFLSHHEAFNRIVHDLVAATGGSISAEHGIGLTKRDALARCKDPVALALALYRSLKAALDPLDLMNPGKLLARP